MTTGDWATSCTAPSPMTARRRINRDDDHHVPDMLQSPFEIRRRLYTGSDRHSATRQPRHDPMATSRGPGRVRGRDPLIRPEKRARIRRVRWLAIVAAVTALA